MVEATFQPSVPAGLTLGSGPVEGPRVVEARLERWLMSLLDGKDAVQRDQRTTSDVIEALGDFDWLRRAQRGGNDPKVAMASSKARVERARLKVTRHSKGIAIVRLLVTSLLREQDLDELAETLDCLVLSGTRSLLIDFAPVEKMSSQVVAHLGAVQRRCVEEGDGRVAVCGLRPALAELFAITGLAAAIPVYLDERSALAADWPGPSGPRPLPVAAIQALRRRSGLGVESTAEPEGELGASAAELMEESVRDDAPLAEVESVLEHEGARELQAWLVVVSGPRASRGRAVRIGERPLVIGRDPECAVRSHYPGLSRRHASIERRGDKLVLRDLGSTNGTAVKGRILRDEAIELTDRARIAIGPLRFVVAIGIDAGPSSINDETIVEWLRDPEEEEERAAERQAADTRMDLPRFAGEETATFETLRATVIEGVLVVAPRKARLEGEGVVEDLRKDLQALLEPTWPRRTVINLVAVDQISSQAVGVLLAHALHLEREGGGMRLCQINPRVLALLERIKVPQILDTLNNLDEAVLTKW